MWTVSSTGHHCTSVGSFFPLGAIELHISYATWVPVMWWRVNHTELSFPSFNHMRDAFKSMTIEASFYYNLKKKLNLAVLYLVIQYVIRISLPHISFFSLLLLSNFFIDMHPLHMFTSPHRPVSSVAYYIPRLKGGGFWKMTFKLGHFLGDLPEIWQAEKLYFNLFLMATDLVLLKSPNLIKFNLLIC